MRQLELALDTYAPYLVGTVPFNVRSIDLRPPAVGVSGVDEATVGGGRSVLGEHDYLLISDINALRVMLARDSAEAQGFLREREAENRQRFLGL